MYAGRIVEEAGTRELFASPKHPYTAGLLRSIPRLGEAGPEDGRGKRRLAAIQGTVPDLADLPSRCAFGARCPDAMPECRERPPALPPLARAGPAVACRQHHAAQGK